jgi:hypothetical protein
MTPLPLEPSTGLTVAADARPHLDEPPPVRLVAIDDVRLPMPPGAVAALDEFYVGLWRFDREPGPDLVYRAENVRLRFFEVADPLPIQRQSVRPQGIELPSLADAQRLLLDREKEFLRQRGITPGLDSLLLLDPAGNWVELFESRQIR